MADVPADLDLTTDLNAQSGDVLPYHGDAVPQHRQGDVPAPAPEADEKPAPSLRDTLTDAFKGETAPKVDEAPKEAETPGQSENKPDLVKVG